VRNLTLSPLDLRKQSILKAVVTDYVRTAEPVGSRALVDRYHFGVRSATIRNEMAELSEMGYLRQPHTSAGRIPSDLGYRFYVDRLMDQPTISSSEAATVRNSLMRRAEIDFILHETCRILSGLARYTSLATHPNVKDAVLKHITISRIGQRKFLAVLVLDDGGVIHEIFEISQGSGKIDPIRATNFLAQQLVGKSLSSLNAGNNEPSNATPEMEELLGKVKEFVKKELEAAEETDVHMEGTSYIMQQPEFKDVNRLETVLSALEERRALYKLFSSVYLGPGVTVIIGEENPVDAMHECSFVGTKYRIGNRIAGTIGVVGPTRMDYRRAVAAVEFMARNLEQLLEELRVA
jgi:heat-inducible transcriptional repressor